MLQAIFYARFHPERGPSIIHKYPNDFTIASHTHEAGARPIIPWNEISPYIIPPYDLCNRPLAARNSGYTILGFPVSLEADRYPRNRFTFNVCFVVAGEEGNGVWEPLVRKTAAFFAALEEEDGLLRAEEHIKGLKWPGDAEYPVRGLGVVYKILEGILDGLNTYGEACVRYDDLHVLNLRPFRAKQALASKVRGWDVPLLVRALPREEDWTWDLALTKIYKHVDGVNHVQRIAELADTEVKLVKKTIRELVYHGRAQLLDVFHFQAIYMLTSAFAIFARTEELQDECRSYIYIDPSLNPLNEHQHDSPAPPNAHLPPTKQDLLMLYRALNAGTSVQLFIQQNQSKLLTTDIRRFITYGVLKGFVRRMHKYALAIQSSTNGSQQHSGGSSLGVAHTVAPPQVAKSSLEAREEFDRAWRKAALSSGWETPPSDQLAMGIEDAMAVQRPRAGTGIGVGEVHWSRTEDGVVVRYEAEDERLRKYLDGRHCLDQICVEMHMSEKRVVERLAEGRFGEVTYLIK